MHRKLTAVLSALALVGLTTTIVFAGFHFPGAGSADTTSGSFVLNWFVVGGSEGTPLSVTLAAEGFFDCDGHQVPFGPLESPEVPILTGKGSTPFTVEVGNPVPQVGCSNDPHWTHAIVTLSDEHGALLDQQPFTCEGTPESCRPD